MKNPKSTFSADASAWNLSDYRKAITLVCAMQEAGVLRTDPDLQLYARGIGRFHQEHFLTLSSGADVLVVWN